jgi:four helix bundle protein
MTNDEDDFEDLEMALPDDDFWVPLIPDDQVVFREDTVAYASGGRKYDLEERTARYGEAIIRFLKKIPQGPITNRLIDQLVGAATSVGANYCEADDAVSKRDFRNKIGTCRKESRESKFFLRMMATAVPEQRAEARELWREAHELNLIFATIFRNTVVE